MRNFLVALAVTGLFSGFLPKAFGQNDLRQPNETAQSRLREVEDEARYNALLMSLPDVYQKLMEREQGLTAEEQRRISNAIDQGRLAIPKLTTAIRELYARFHGDRVLAGVSLGIGGEAFLRNNRIPLAGRTPYFKQLATGVDFSVGVAAVLIHNNIEGGMPLPEFSGYYSFGLNEIQMAGAVNKNLTKGAAKVGRTGNGQGFAVWRVYFVPRNLLTTLNLVRTSSDPSKTPAYIGALAGTYVGGGFEGWRTRVMGTTTAVQTQVYGRWTLPKTTEEILPQLAPEVIMISLAPTVGMKTIRGFTSPQFSTQAGAQVLGFFGVDWY